MSPVSRTYKNVYQFKITLNEITPTIWRRIHVPGHYSFWDCHVAIQDAMGWQDSHLHMFRVPDPSAVDETMQIGIPDEDRFVDDPVILPGWELAIADSFSAENAKAQYEYDFGDGWEHTLILEQILPRKPKTKYPACLAGERRCPPEDCGGPPGYEELLRVLADPRHEEHDSMLTWVGGSYDPTNFDPKQVRFDNPEKRWDHAFGPLG